MSIRFFFQKLLPLAAALLLTGCMGSPFSPRLYDVSSNPAWWGEMYRGEILALNQDTLLNGAGLELSAYKNTDTYDSNAIFGHSITVEMFKANPGKYWDDLHLLSKGTRLRCVKLGRYFSSVGSSYELDAEILDGEFKGKVVCVSPVWGEPEKKGSLKLGPYSLVHPVEQ
jgi:hypothetical protein